MSFQSSSHFDSTTLLIVRPEIDNTIKNVETGVSSLLEDGALPYGIEDALLNLEQSSHVLHLIEQPYLGLLTSLISQVMKKILADAGQNNINLPDVEAMSDATNVTKRYLDFLCVRETRAPQFLIETINKLELVLGLPLTSDSIFVSPYLQTISPDVSLNAPTQLPQTQYVNRLYKLSLLKFLTDKETDLDYQAMALCGNYLAAQAIKTPSAKYWGYVHLVLSELGNMIITQPRLRILIQIEQNIADFLQNPNLFKAPNAALIDVISLILTQENEVSQQIRNQLNIADDVLSDDQLQVLSRQLYGPDLNTIETIVALLSDLIKDVSLKLETTQYIHNEADRVSISDSLDEIAKVLDVINLNDSAQQIRTQSQTIRGNQNLDNPMHATQLMNSLLFTTNSLQILARNFTPNRLKLKLNNSNITLEKVEEAQSLLCQEARASLSTVSTHIINFVSNNSLEEFENLPNLLRETSGALLFLESSAGHENLQKLAKLVETHVITNKQALNAEQVKLFATVVASADFYLEQLQTRQPRIESTMKIGKRNLDQLLLAVA